jgi:hypothetical protein
MEWRRMPKKQQRAGLSGVGARDFLDWNGEDITVGDGIPSFLEELDF